MQTSRLINSLRKAAFISNNFSFIHSNMSTSAEELIEKGKKASAYKAIDDNVNKVSIALSRIYIYIL